MDSCTFEPKSIKFKRNNINLELIDSAGNNDLNNNDIENLKKYVKNLVIKKRNRLYYFSIKIWRKTKWRNKDIYRNFIKYI